MMFKNGTITSLPNPSRKFNLSALSDVIPHLNGESLGIAEGFGEYGIFSHRWIIFDL